MPKHVDVEGQRQLRSLRKGLCRIIMMTVRDVRLNLSQAGQNPEKGWFTVLASRLLNTTGHHCLSSNDELHRKK